MSYFYFIEKKKFDEEMEAQEEFYRKHGMAEEAIEEMKNHDYILFKKIE